MVINGRPSGRLLLKRLIRVMIEIPVAYIYIETIDLTKRGRVAGMKKRPPIKGG